MQALYERTYMLRTEIIMRHISEGTVLELPRVVDALVGDEHTICVELVNTNTIPSAIFNALYELAH